MTVINTAFEIVSGPANSHLFSFDATGADCLYIAIAFDESTAKTFSGVEYNEAPATPIDSNETGRSIYLYRLLAPTAGSNSLFVDWDGTQSGVSISVLALSGVHQTTPETGSAATGGTGASITTPATTSSANDTVYAFGYLNNSAIADVTEGSNQTLVDEDGLTNGVSWISSKTGADPTQTMNWTVTSQSFGVVAVSVAAAATTPQITDFNGGKDIIHGKNFTVTIDAPSSSEYGCRVGTFEATFVSKAGPIYTFSPTAEINALNGDYPIQFWYKPL